MPEFVRDFEGDKEARMDYPAPKISNVKDELCDCLGQVTCPMHGDSDQLFTKHNLELEIQDLRKQLADIKADINRENVRLCNTFGVTARSEYEERPSCNRYEPSNYNGHQVHSNTSWNYVYATNGYQTHSTYGYQIPSTYGYQTPFTNGYQTHPPASSNVPFNTSCVVHPVHGCQVHLSSKCSVPSSSLPYVDSSSALQLSIECESHTHQTHPPASRNVPFNTSCVVHPVHGCQVHLSSKCSVPSSSLPYVDSSSVLQLSIERESHTHQTHPPASRNVPFNTSCVVHPVHGCQVHLSSKCSVPSTSLPYVDSSSALQLSIERESHTHQTHPPASRNVPFNTSCVVHPVHGCQVHLSSKCSVPSSSLPYVDSSSALQLSIERESHTHQTHPPASRNVPFNTSCVVHPVHGCQVHLSSKCSVPSTSLPYVDSSSALQLSTERESHTHQTHPPASRNVPFNTSCVVHPVHGCQVHLSSKCSVPSSSLPYVSSSASEPTNERESHPHTSLSIAAPSIGSQAPSDFDWCNLFNGEAHSPSAESGAHTSSDSECHSVSDCEHSSLYDLSSSNNSEAPFGSESQTPCDREKQTTSCSEFHNSSGSEYSAAGSHASPASKIISPSDSRQMDQNDTHSVKEILQSGVQLMETLPRCSSTQPEPRTQPMVETETAEFDRQSYPQYPLWSNYGVCTASICSGSANVSPGEIFTPQQADLNGENVRLCNTFEVTACNEYEARPSCNTYEAPRYNGHQVPPYSELEVLPHFGNYEYQTHYINKYKTSTINGYPTPSTNGYQTHPPAFNTSCAVHPVHECLVHLSSKCSVPSSSLYSVDSSSASQPSYEGESHPHTSASISAPSVGLQAPSYCHWCNLFNGEPHSPSESAHTSSDSERHSVSDCECHSVSDSECHFVSDCEHSSLYDLSSSNNPEAPFGSESQTPCDREKQTASGSELHNSSGSEYSAAGSHASPVFKIPLDDSRQMNKNDSPQYSLWSDYGVCTASICSGSANIFTGDIFKPQPGRDQSTTSQSLPWDRDSCVRMFESLLS